MILDINTLLSNAQAVTVTAVSTSVYDTAGQGVNVPVTNIVGLSGATPPAAAAFGNDIGIGDGVSPPNLLCQVTTTFTAGGSATLQVQLQAAIDSGSGVPGTWNTLAEQDPVPVATLVAGTKIAEFTVPPHYPGVGAPRFYRLNYVVATGPMTAGALTAAILTGRDDQIATPANF